MAAITSDSLTLPAGALGCGPIIPSPAGPTPGLHPPPLTAPDLLSGPSARWSETELSNYSLVVLKIASKSVCVHVCVCVCVWEREKERERERWSTDGPYLRQLCHGNQALMASVAPSSSDNSLCLQRRSVALVITAFSLRLKSTEHTKGTQSDSCLILQMYILFFSRIMQPEVHLCQNHNKLDFPVDLWWCQNAVCSLGVCRNMSAL